MMSARSAKDWNAGYGWTDSTTLKKVTFFRPSRSRRSSAPCSSCEVLTVVFSPVSYQNNSEMSSRRIAKVAEALRECVSTTVLFALKDPRVKNVTVLRTEVSPDLRSARVYVSVMGDEKAQALSMHGLRSSRGFIQAQIADRLELRYTPILSFVLDP